jgi:hypothetical protein
LYIYLASAYAIGDQAVNVRKSLEVAEQLIAMGHTPYVPLLTHFWHFASPHSQTYWLDLDLQWLANCDAVLRLPGESKGADMEVEYAKDINILIYYDIEDIPKIGV